MIFLDIMFTLQFQANLLTIVAMSGRNVDAHVGVHDVHVVVEPPAPLRARPVAGDVEVELGVPGSQCCGLGSILVKFVAKFDCILQ
jgi:hypothetical protein